MKALLLTAVLALAGAAPVAAQAIPEAELRALATTASTGIKAGDGDAVVNALDKAVKAKFGDLETRAVTVFHTDHISVFLTAPYPSYRATLRNTVRKMEDIGDIPYEPDEVSVVVVPKTIHAFDVEKIIVMRDAQIIEPTKATLAVQELKTRIGAPFDVHVGDVTFPASAFAPGAVVTVTLVRRVGKNIEKKFDSDALKKIR